ncbi:MAG TPA: pyridoxal-dependent decarboxylase [Bacteroidota bacterium]
MRDTTSGTTTNNTPTEETLDPQNWDEMRTVGHQMVDDMLDYLMSVRQRPIWQSVPDGVKPSFAEPAPENGLGPAETYEQFKKFVLPYPMGTIHPRFWGWVIGSGTPFGMLSEMLAATLNVNASGFKVVAGDVENQVVKWCKEMLGYPQEASGILVSGGSMANLVGLAVALQSKAGVDFSRDGLLGSTKRFTVYASAETHSSVAKAVRLFGLGTGSLRLIPVNEDFSVNLTALRDTIAKDKAEGLQPFCIIGNAGTVNTGAFDALDDIADICEKERLWFHVDGAFGALAALSTSANTFVKGMERADSLAFDLHKWMYMPYEVGCTLIRRADEHQKAFAVRATYLQPQTRGYAAGDTLWHERGLQLSRGFRALKVWMSIKEHGVAKYRRLIQQNIDQAQYLAALVKDSANLEILAPHPLNIVCFRFRAEGKSDEQLNKVNEEILMRIQERGIAIPSSTLIHGKYAFRVAITNHRSRNDDFKALVDSVVSIGKEVLAGI